MMVDGERKKLCKICSEKALKKKLQAKKEKIKEKRREKRERITDKKLDTVFARLIKEIYPLVCHACGKKLTKGTIDCQAAHFIGRRAHILRWNPRNVLPACSRCNGFDQSHVFELGKKINMYYGEGTAEHFREMQHITKKWDEYDRKRLYELFCCTEDISMEELRKKILNGYDEIQSEKTK